MVGCGLSTSVGFIISPRLGLALGGMTLVVYVGTVAWAIRYGRRRSHDLGESGALPDLRYLQRRLLIFWAIMFCFVGAATGVAVVLTSPDYSGPAWPPILMLLLMASALMAIWMFAPVVLPRRLGQGH